MLKYMWARMVVWVHRHICVCVCIWSLPLSLSILLFEAGLLSPELTSLANLANQLSLEIPCLHLPNTGITGGPPHQLSIYGIYIGPGDLTVLTLT